MSAVAVCCIVAPLVVVIVGVVGIADVIAVVVVVSPPGVFVDVDVVDAIDEVVAGLLALFKAIAAAAAVVVVAPADDDVLDEYADVTSGVFDSLVVAAVHALRFAMRRLLADAVDDDDDVSATPAAAAATACDIANDGPSEIDRTGPVMSGEVCAVRSKPDDDDDDSP